MKWKSLIALVILAVGCGSPTHKIPQSIKEITNLITLKNKVSKKDIYNYCIKLKNEI